MQTAPPLPEPYKAPPSMFCIACGAPYEVSRAIAPMAAGGNPLFTSSLCKCGSNQFKGTFGGETVCPQFTCDQITERDAYWIERLEEIEKIRDYEEDEATKFAHQVVELQKCLRAAEADARLYRWLSDHCVLVVEDLRSTLPGIAITVRAQSWTECADSSALKNAIDRAMGSTTSGEV